MAERTPERLVRLLGMVAYVERNPGVGVEQLAEHFDVTAEQVLRDVDTLWVSGTPGYWPDDLIDFDAGSLESGVLRLTQSRGIGHALRLGTREAVTLVAALRALDEAVGDTLPDADREVLATTLATLTEATGDAAAAMDVHLAVEAPAVLARARGAVAAGHRVRVRYVDAADRVSEREVDPWQVLTGDEHSYLHGWCHLARGERTFRLDRILALDELDAPATTEPRPARDPEAFLETKTLDVVRVVLDGEARWVADQLPVEGVRDVADGGVELTLRMASPGWLRHLLLGLAEHVRSVDPSTVAREAAQDAARALEAYGTRDAATDPTG